MADEEKPSPFARTLPPPTEGGPSPFARPPAPVRVAAKPVVSATGGESLPMGFMAGLVAAVVGAALWAVITVLTGYQIGWMAVGVGFLVGIAVRAAGKGTTTAFGVLGAVLALGGCLAGNLLTGCIVLSRELDVSLLALSTRLTPDVTMELMKAMFSPIDLLFYALAIWQGYKFSIVGAAAEG